MLPSTITLLCKCKAIKLMDLEKSRETIHTLNKTFQVSFFMNVIQIRNALFNV